MAIVRYLFAAGEERKARWARAPQAGDAVGTRMGATMVLSER
jgi:hypothetical protein